MTDPTRIIPDVWLVLSPAVLDELRGRWSRLAQSALMDLRLRDLSASLVEWVPMDELRERIELKVAAGWQRVRVVFDGYGDKEHASLAGLASEAASHVRWHDYRRDPLAVVDTLRAPEDAVLEAWQASRPAMVDLRLFGPGIDDAWRRRYLAAFRQWEEDTRAADPELFEEAFPEPADRGEAGGIAVVLSISPHPANDEVFALAASGMRGRRTQGRRAAAAADPDERGAPEVPRLRWSDETTGIEVQMQPPVWSMAIVHVWIQSPRIDWKCVTRIRFYLGDSVQVDVNHRSPNWKPMGDGSGLRLDMDRVLELLEAMTGGVPAIRLEVLGDNGQTN